MHFELNELPKASLELVGLQEPFTEEETDQIIKLAKQRRLLWVYGGYWLVISQDLYALCGCFVMASVPVLVLDMLHHDLRLVHDLLDLLADRIDLLFA